MYPSHPEGIKQKMRGHKLISVYWQGTLRQKGVKQERHKKRATSTVFLDPALCTLAHIGYLYTKLHGIVSEKEVMFIAIALRMSYVAL
jgi:hypothetical protein